MIVGLLRIFYVLLPISLMSWVLMDNASFTRSIEYCNSLQGRSGAFVINPEGKETYGTQMEKWIEKKIPIENENWRYVYRSIGTQTDVAIRYIENYWLWGSITFLLLMGIFFLLAHKNYK